MKKMVKNIRIQLNCKEKCLILVIYVVYIIRYITKSVVFICNIDISTEGYTNSSDIKKQI